MTSFSIACRRRQIIGMALQSNLVSKNAAYRGSGVLPQETFRFLDPIRLILMHSEG